MYHKLTALVLMLVAGILLLSGCGQPPAPQVVPTAVPSVPADTTSTMSLEEARDIAQHSTCVEVGLLTDNAFYNDSTGTWWIDLDAEQPGCAPACVVNVSTKAAEVNWRCTGALPPTEEVTEADAQPVPDPALARDVALAYLRETYADLAPKAGLSWTDENITEPGMVGASTFRYTAESWVAVVSYPIVNPADTIFRVEVSNPDAILLWEGDVDMNGNVTESRALDGSRQAICWGGFIKSLPAGAQFDDYLALDGENGLGIEAADNTVAAQIQMVRDSETFVHHWGTLHCPAIDYGGCQLIVTRLREDRPGPLPDPESVDSWEGTVWAFDPGMQYDDYFTLKGDFQVHYGINSMDANLQAQLESLRDSGEFIRVWGQVTCGVPDAYGAQIEVTQIERLGVQ